MQYRNINERILSGDFELLPSDFDAPASLRQQVLMFDDPIYLQQVCEKLFVDNPICALKMMTHVYELADQKFCHSVADAVELYITNNRTGELDSYVRELVSLCDDEDLKTVYLSWLD